MTGTGGICASPGAAAPGQPRQVRRQSRSAALRRRGSRLELIRVIASNVE